MEFDPAVISYEELLAVFWESHDPTQDTWSRQYRAAVFFHGERQKRLATESRARLGGRTAIEPAGTFWRAEDYHQKFRLRSTPAVMEEFRQLCPGDRAFVDSTAAARVNGFLDGHVRPEALAADVPAGVLAKLKE